MEAIRPLLKLHELLYKNIDGKSGLSPALVLERWWSCGTDSKTTAWGDFVSWACPERTDDLLWASINLSHLDSARRVLEDKDVRQWFPTLRKDLGHVKKVHSVSGDVSAREVYLSASFIAERLEALKTPSAARLLQRAWIMPLATSPNSPPTAPGYVTFVANDDSSDIDLIRPDLGTPTTLLNILDATNKAAELQRYKQFLERLALKNRNGRTPTALIRFPAGYTAPNRYLVDFYHAVRGEISETLLGSLKTATDLATLILQGVLAPELMRRVEKAQQSVLLSNVLGHDVKNLHSIVSSSVATVRRQLPKETPTIQATLDELGFVTEMFHGVTAAYHACASDQNQGTEPIQDLLKWLEGLTPSRCEGRKLLLEVDTPPEVRCVPAEVRMILANLLHNAAKNNGTTVQGTIRDDVRILVRIGYSHGKLHFTVGSEAPFSCEDWLAKNLTTNGFPTKNRGLWLCRELLMRAEAGRLRDVPFKDFGCGIVFDCPTS